MAEVTNKQKYKGKMYYFKLPVKQKVTEIERKKP